MNSYNNLHKDEGSLYRCGNCNIIFNAGYARLKYDSKYFLDDYKKQYGRTYKEDFGNINSISKKRLKRIIDIAGLEGGLKNKSILDIGCAMGFFLNCARDMGFTSVEGVEISKYAADYCVKHYNIKVKNNSFEKINFKKLYDVITAWYFIEHSEKPVPAFKKIFNLLKDDGIFAFSTPSFFGPQFVFKRTDWIKNHPVDHRIDFTPLSLKKFLKEIGFKKVIIFAGGIHPERILPENSIFFNFFKLIYNGISKMITFSDTIEVYAIK